MVRAAYRRSPLAGRTRTLSMREGVSLAELVAEAAPEPWLRRHVVASIDGEEIPRAAWEARRLSAGDRVVLFVRPANGGGNSDGGSNWLRTILAIVVIVVATWVSQGGWTPAAMEWAAPFLGAAVAIVGNLAINALIPLKSGALGAERPAPFYSITGARNRMLPYEAVPTLLGRSRYTPPLYGVPVQETVGDDIYLRMVFCLGPGPLADADLKIGETLLSEYDGVEIEKRLKPDDPPHTLYLGDPSQDLVGAGITTDFQSRTTATGADEIEIVLGFRGGLGALDEKGRKTSKAVTFQVQYRLHGSSEDWTSLLPTVEQSNAVMDELGVPIRTKYGEVYPGLTQYTDALNSAGGVAGGPIIIARSDPGRGFQRVVRWAVPRGQYDVRIRRTTAETAESNDIDAVWWELLSSLKSAVNPFPTPAMASIALRIKATGQLNNVVDTFNLICQRLGPSFSEEARTDPASATAADHSGEGPIRNPSDLTLWIYRGALNPRPLADDKVDWPAWAEFAEHCRVNNLHFDEPIEQSMTRGAAAQRICAAGFGRPVWINGKLSVMIDRPRDGEAPAQVFTPRNVRNFRWTKTFAPEVHAVRIGFANEDNGWQTDEVTLYLDGYAAQDVFDEESGDLVARGATLFETIELPGKTNADEIRRVGRQYINNAIAQTEGFSFEMDAESLTATLGAFVVVQHDVMATGLGAARIRSLVMSGGDVVGVRLDAPIASEPGPTLAARWRELKNDGEWVRFEVTNEAAVARDPDDPTAFSFVAPREPEDAPSVGDVFLLGETGKVALEALIKSIAPEMGDQASISLVAYAPERFTPDGSPLPPHDPKVTVPYGSRPATPVLLSVSARSREITVSFVEPASPRGVTLTGFEARVREHGDADDSWAPLGLLGPEARVVVAPAGDPGASYDIEIIAVGRDNGGLVILSDPLLVEDIDAAGTAPAPADFDAEFVIRTSPSGARQLVLVASWTPNQDPDVLDTRIDLETGEDVWTPIGGGRAAAGGCEIHGLQVGRSYSLSAINVTRRGAESERIALDAINAPDILVATQAVDLDPTGPAAERLDDVEADLDAFELDLSEVEAGLDRIARHQDDFPGFWLIGGHGGVTLEANTDGVPSSITVGAGYFDHPIVEDAGDHRIEVAETWFRTPWGGGSGASLAPANGWFAIVWSEEATATRFANKAGAGHVFPATYDFETRQWTAWKYDIHSGEVFTPEPTDVVLGRADKPLQAGSDALSVADGVETVESFVRETNVVNARFDSLEAVVGDAGDPANASGSIFARYAHLVIVQASDNAARAAETATLIAQMATANSNISTNATAIASEAAARASADSTLTANLATANAAISTNATAIATEAATRASADTTLTANLATANANISTNATAIATEAATRASADSTLTANLATANSNISTNATAIANEAAARASADTTLTANLATANANISTNATAIATEAATRASADSTLTANLATANANISTNATAIAAEAATRASADSTLTANLATANANISTNATAIAAETASRASADATLTASIATNTASISTHTSAIAALNSAIALYYGVKLTGTGLDEVSFELFNGTPFGGLARIKASKFVVEGDALFDGSVAARSIVAGAVGTGIYAVGGFTSLLEGDYTSVASFYAGENGDVVKITWSGEFGLSYSGASTSPIIGVLRWRVYRSGSMLQQGSFRNLMFQKGTWEFECPGAEGFTFFDDGASGSELYEIKIYVDYFNGDGSYRGDGGSELQASVGYHALRVEELVAGPNQLNVSVAGGAIAISDEWWV